MIEESPQPVERWRELLLKLRSRARGPALFVAGVAATFLAIVLYQYFYPPPAPLTMKEVNTSIAGAIASVTPAPAFSANVYQVIQPSLILVQSERVGADGDAEGGLGSGVVISAEGDILTSLHVVTGSVAITLTFADGTASPAEITTAQPENDIAVLKALAPPAEIFPAVMGNPGAMRVGDEAYAVGNPFGLYSSMSAGVISAFGRSFQPVGSAYELEDLIQIDTAVNPGNSGGPLLNRYGEVIGIVTGLVNPTEQNFFVGIGFAVPITTASGAAGAPPY